MSLSFESVSAKRQLRRASEDHIGRLRRENLSLCAEARTAPRPVKFSRVSSPLASAHCPLSLQSLKIVSALNGNFPCGFEDLANNVEIVFLRFFVDHTVGRKSSDHPVVSARRQFPLIRKISSSPPSRPRGSA